MTKPIDRSLPVDTGILPLKDPKQELFVRKVCDGVSPHEAYIVSTGKNNIDIEWAKKLGKRWMRECAGRIQHIMDERAQNFIRADDHIRVMKEKAAITRSRRAHVDVSTFEGRKQFFQDVCDDYQFNDGIEVTEAINAVKELMKINGDFTRREDDVAKTDPAMVMAVIARAHLMSPESQGKGVLDIVSAQKTADAMREYFKLDYVHLAAVNGAIDVVSKSQEMSNEGRVIAEPKSSSVKKLKITEL